MFIFYVLPAILLVMLLASIFTTQNYIYKFGDLMFVSGLLLVPSFTRIIANTEFRIVSIGKKVISYMPLFTGYIIILYIALGYLEFFDPLRISLGDFLNYVTTQVNDAPWASFWPGLTAFLIVISLFTLHEGLVQHSR